MSRKGIPPSRTRKRAGREGEKEHKHTPPPHLRASPKLFSHSTGILHTILTSGSRQTKRVPSKPVVTAAFFKTFTLRHAKGAREGGIEPENSSFLLQIILQVRSKCSTLPRRKKGKTLQEKMNSESRKTNQVGNLRRFESKFHNASLRSSFKVFPEAHPHGIIINVLKKGKCFDANGWPMRVHGGCCRRCVSLFISKACGDSGRSPPVVQSIASS